MARILSSKRSGRKPTRLARLLKIIRNDLQVGNAWETGATTDEIAEKLYPEEYKENSYKAKMMTRGMIATLRKKLPELYEAMTGIKLPANFFPFFSSKPSVIVKGKPQTDPLGKYRYFYHLDTDSLEKVRVKLDNLQRALAKRVVGIEKMKELVEKNLYPENLIEDIEEEIDKLGLEPEEKIKLMKRLKKKIVLEEKE